ncbi:MAG: P1 family peptidase [Coriobacteriales bacterium]|jgi:L-aminopeptidase/D-esterase-like protein|nr:P1 family peptidase [Coriobacteriales bacterium]
MDIDVSGFLSGSEALLPEGFFVGNAQDETARTGCTVILCPAGAVAGVDVRGAAPATRETDLLRPENMVPEIHAVLFCGGSAYGLDAASGVMRYLEECGHGLLYANTVVPIVCAAALFDLLSGDADVRPDAAMGLAACQAAAAQLTVGRVGAGCGATVGKLLGMASTMPGGLGACSFIAGDLLVTAVVVVNALGNIYDASSGRALAGTLDPLGEKPQIIDPLLAFSLSAAATEPGGAGGWGGGDWGGGFAAGSGDWGGGSPGSGFAAGSGGAGSACPNTTLGCVLTNANLSKAQANRVAMMAHDGYARAIHPVHTSNDGDAIFCMARGTVGAHPDLVGTLAALAMEHAIHNAVSQ